MKVLSRVDSQHFVAIDIETVRIAENFSDLSELYQEAWEYKHKQDGEIPSIEELSELWSKTSSLYAEFSKVCVVSLAFLDKAGKNLMCKSFSGEDEAKILTELSEFLDRISSSSPHYRLVGHASKFFDYPFLGKRYIINQIPIPRLLDDSDKKPWETLNTCTNTLWKLGGTGAGSSLQALCVCLNIPISKVDMVGDEVGREYFNGNIQGITDYCNKDAIATFNVIRRFKYEDIFQFEDVVYLDKLNLDSEVSSGNVLHKLSITKELNQEVKEGIIKAFKGKKVPKKDWEMLEDVLKCLYINNKMFSSDTKEVVEHKKKEVEEFIKELKSKK
jgi:hypothetical protein